jgi:DNA mismatch repair protein MutH
MQEYDLKSVKSIYEFSLKLTGKTLRQVVNLPNGIENSRNRGDLGTLLERYFFRHVPPNNHEPDFPDASLELKTTGLVRSEKSIFRAKERLVLSLINYSELATEEWERSNFLRKNSHLLLVFYEFDKGKSVADRVFPIPPMLFTIPSEDVATIRKDWEFIRNKVREGKAHELSEGDTFYLAACRKGSGGESEKLNSQPFSSTKAKSRAFSFKQSYVNRILTLSSASGGTATGMSVEQEALLKLEPYIGKSVDEIEERFQIHKKDSKQKAFNRSLVTHIFSDGFDTLPKLKDAGIQLKTVKVNKSNKPKEAMSFPAFVSRELISQTWEDSDFFEVTEKKFLFVVFKLGDDGVERLYKAGFWNMPYDDRQEAKRVWERTKDVILAGDIDFPKGSESKVAHVRPHARNAQDTETTPLGITQTKKCFWLNREYVARIIDSQL